MDYSHPRFYIVPALIAIIVTGLMGLTIARGFYFGVIGLAVFPMIYYFYRDEYDRDERHFLIEIAMSFGGFIILPIGFSLGWFDSIIPTTLDIVFFVVGFGSMVIATNLLYLVEPENPKQLALTLVISGAILSLIILLIKLYTIGGYLGGFA